MSSHASSAYVQLALSWQPAAPLVLTTYAAAAALVCDSGARRMLQGAHAAALPTANRCCSAPPLVPLAEPKLS